MIVINTNMATKAGYSDPRAFVENDEWTRSKFKELVENLAIVENGETKVYGLALHPQHIYDVSFYASGFEHVRKNGDSINIPELSRERGCKVIEISALKGTGIPEITEAVITAAKSGKTYPQHSFSGTVEHALAHIEEACLHSLPQEQHRWYAIKILKRCSIKKSSFFP